MLSGCPYNIHGIALYHFAEEFSQCLLDRDTNSLLTELLKFMLTAIFGLQEEEEAELQEDEQDDQIDDVKGQICKMLHG